MADAFHVRTHGVLTKWNDERGFGFIAPAGGGDELFVHVSAFPRDGVRPRLDEFVSFEIENAPDGRMRAIRIMRPGGQVPGRPRLSRRAEKPGTLASRLATVFGLLAVAAIGTYAYTRVSGDAPVGAAANVAVSPVAGTASTAPSTAFRCDGRTMCSQMTSCAEARYFLQHCPGTRMDGNGDGEPCEQQWCN